MKVLVVGTNQKDRERVAKVIKDKYRGPNEAGCGCPEIGLNMNDWEDELLKLAEENADLLKKLERSNDAWIREREEVEKQIADKKVLLVEKDKQIAALTAENKRLRDRLKSHGDIETDKEEIAQAAIKEEQRITLIDDLGAANGKIATLTESCNYWRRLWRLTEAAERKAGEEIAALKEENLRLKSLLHRRPTDCDPLHIIS